MKAYPVQPLDLMQFINTKYHDPFIHEWLEFQDRPDPERLIGAVDRLAAAFPLLNCRYDEKSNVFLENGHRSGRDLVRIDDGADRTVLLTEALDAGQELIRLTLCRNALAITVSHMICDGNGFKQLLYLLCGLYNDGSAQAPGRLMARDFAQLTEGLTGRMAITLKMLLSMAGSYKSLPVYAAGGQEAAHVLERTIPGGTMSRVHRLAKEQGATLNDVFLTAYARALAKLYGREKINIPCTVDLRKYAKGATGVGNLTGTYNLNIRMKDGAGFGETLAEVSALMGKQKKTKNDLAGPMLLVSKYEKTTLEQFLRLYGGMQTSASADYTNLGILDDRQLVFDGAELKNAVGYSGLNKAPSFQVAVSSFRGETTITSLVRCGEAEKEKADRILDAIAGEIGAFS